MNQVQKKGIKDKYGLLKRGDIIEEYEICDNKDFENNYLESFIKKHPIEYLSLILDTVDALKSTDEVINDKNIIDTMNKINKNKYEFHIKNTSHLVKIIKHLLYSYKYVK